MSSVGVVSVFDPTDMGAQLLAASGVGPAQETQSQQDAKTCNQYAPWQIEFWQNSCWNVGINADGSITAGTHSGVALPQIPGTNAGTPGVDWLTGLESSVSQTAHDAIVNFAILLLAVVLVALGVWSVIKP